MTSHKTAIRRTKISAPMKHLCDAGLLFGRMLDYGCGRGFDADQFGMEKYDPYFCSSLPEGKFDVITCNYVLNVLEHDVQIESVLKKIRGLLKDNGVAYIAVRRDVKQDGYTNKMTYQRNVVLDLPVLTERKGKYTIYKIDNGA